MRRGFAEVAAAALEVRDALEALRRRNVSFAVDGELQADAALVPAVGVLSLTAALLLAPGRKGENRYGVRRSWI